MIFVTSNTVTLTYGIPLVITPSLFDSQSGDETYARTSRRLAC